MLSPEKPAQARIKKFSVIRINHIDTMETRLTKFRERQSDDEEGKLTSALESSVVLERRFAAFRGCTILSSLARPLEISRFPGVLTRVYFARISRDGEFRWWEICRYTALGRETRVQTVIPYFRLSTARRI